MGAHSGRNRSEIFPFLRLEAVMLLKTQSVRRDLKEFSGPTRFLITMNLKGLSDDWGSVENMRSSHTCEA